MATISPERLAVSITEAAQLIGCTRPFVYKLLEDGRLSSVELGHRVRRIPLEQIHALLGIENEAPVTV